jgi:hypothetical protein
MRLPRIEGQSEILARWPDDLELVEGDRIEIRLESDVVTYLRNGEVVRREADRMRPPAMNELVARLRELWRVCNPEDPPTPAQIARISVALAEAADALDRLNREATRYQYWRAHAADVSLYIVDDRWVLPIWPRDDGDNGRIDDFLDRAIEREARSMSDNSNR